MSFKSNGHKRDPKYILSSIFMVCVGGLCLAMTMASDWSRIWDVVSIIVMLLGILMFKNANEL